MARGRQRWWLGVVAAVMGHVGVVGAEVGQPLRDIAYGEAPRQRFDLYPVPQSDRPTPVVVYFHGGGFVRGDKLNVNRKLIETLHQRGIAFVSANYRFAHTALLPAAMHDGARAVQFLRKHANDYGVNAEAFVVSGSSAGAGIALWIALHDDLAEPDAADLVRRQSSRVAGAWLLDAQVSYVPEFWEARGLAGVISGNKVRVLFGSSEELGEADRLARIVESSPITHLSGDDPPVRLDFRAPMELSRNTSAAAMLHHPLHGVALAEGGRAVGMSVEMYYGGGPPAAESGADFVARLVGLPGSSAEVVAE